MHVFAHTEKNPKCGLSEGHVMPNINMLKELKSEQVRDDKRAWTTSFTSATVSVLACQNLAV